MQMTTIAVNGKVSIDFQRKFSVTEHASKGIMDQMYSIL